MAEKNIGELVFQQKFSLLFIFVERIPNFKA